MNWQNINIPLKSFETIYLIKERSKVKYWSLGLLLIMAGVLFLPWTQNIKSNGKVTTLRQEQRPQNVVSPIPGRIVKWWVKEGDFVKKGDTLVQLSEIKEEYLDPKLVARTQQQVNAKVGTIQAYQNKIRTAQSQIEALENAKNLKVQQLQNKQNQLNLKLRSERAELNAMNNEYQLAKDQYERQQKMFSEGLVSQTQLQQRNLTFQNAMSKKISIENKVAQTQQEIINNNIEQSGAVQDYNEKINKAQGDQFQGMGQVETGKGEIAKLENQVMNYSIRNGLYFILAPQDGQIVQATRSGLGEIVKDGERISVIVPTEMEYAVEMFIKPVDLPLISLGQKVRFQFDGFPAIIFSGWPNNSYGTFGGKVVAYENSISPNGFFRVLVSEDSSVRKWPPQLKIGSGARGIALLKDVPAWYELWRNINGFPPDFYQAVVKEIESSKEKK